MKPTAEYYRKNPIKFNLLTASDQIKFITDELGSLDSVTFFNRSYWPDSPYRVIEPSYKTSDESPQADVFRLLELYNASHTVKDYRMVAALMNFFQVECYKSILFRGDLLLIKNFAFGCFDRQHLADHSSDFNSDKTRIQHYLTGNASLLVAVLGIKEFTLINDEQFQRVLDALSEKRFYSNELLTIYNKQLYVTPHNMDKLAPVKVLRTKLFFETLNKRMLSPGTDQPYLYYVCHLKQYCSANNNLPILGYPEWSRRNHLKLATPEFKAKALTVLCMRRFCPDNFPLHKDLIDMILSKIFVFHVKNMSVECETEKKLESALKFSNLRDTIQFGMKWEVPYDASTRKSARQSTRDAIFVSLGGRLPDTIMANYLIQFKRQLPYMPGCKDRIAQLAGDDRDFIRDNQPHLSEAIYAYLKSKNFESSAFEDGTCFLDHDFQL